jgi:serine-type D-Ala-D-Ala carboxypeptidase (penicillin-binding protein 5/6)
MESSIGGTTAHLEKGQIYTVEQLLYGLMLPSGNDASLALAVWAGRKLLKRDA